MTPVLTPAEAFPPGEYLADELHARGWTKAMFAEIIDRPVQAVSEIINGHKEITAETAAAIAAATDTEAETWLHLQDAYRLWQLRRRPDTKPLDDVARRGRLAALVPLKEIRQRGLVYGTLDEQESQVLDLLGISSLTETPHPLIAARRTLDDAPLSPVQWTWLACVRRAIRGIPPLQANRPLEYVASTLTKNIKSPRDLAGLPRLLASAGIHLVYVPTFKGSKIDGAAMAGSHGPVVAISGRIPRLDSVIFTVLHELAHIHLGHTDDGLTLDDTLESDPVVARERAADDLAGSWAVGPDFRTPGVLSRASVTNCANNIGVHPSIVVGRLHHLGALPWTHLNNLIPNVRNEIDALGSSSLTSATN